MLLGIKCPHVVSTKDQNITKDEGYILGTAQCIPRCIVNAMVLMILRPALCILLKSQRGVQQYTEKSGFKKIVL